MQKFQRVPRFGEGIQYSPTDDIGGDGHGYPNCNSHYAQDRARSGLVQIAPGQEDGKTPTDLLMCAAKSLQFLIRSHGFDSIAAQNGSHGKCCRTGADDWGHDDTKQAIDGGKLYGSPGSPPQIQVWETP